MTPSIPNKQFPYNYTFMTQKMQFVSNSLQICYYQRILYSTKELGDPNMSRLKTNLIVILLYLVTIFISFYATNRSSSFDYLNEDNSFTITADQFTPEFSSHEVRPSNHEYETIILGSTFTNLDINNNQYFSIYLHKFGDNAISVYFNDELIGSRGDFEKGRSNLWNGYSVFQIPVSLLKDSNILTLKTYAVYRSGLSAYPITVTTSIVSPRIHHDLELLTSRYTNITIGFMIASVFISIILMLLSKKDKKVFIYTAISSLFLVIYCSDYLTSDFIPVDYLIYKKITMAGLFFGIGFYSYAICEYHKHKPLKYFGHLAVIGFLVIMSISSDMITFKTLYTYYYIVLLVNIFYWIVLSLVNMKKKRTIAFLTGFSILFIYASTQIAIDVLGKHSTVNSPLIYISIIGVMPLLLAYESYIEKDTAIDLESAKRKEAFLNSVTDPLTGAWNQRYLYSLPSQNFIGSVVCVIDFDDFKKINDTYGHVAGDKAIIETCKTINSKIREVDDLIRYGGDEFVAILYNTRLDEAVERISSIISSVERTPIDLDGNKLKITLSIGVYDVVEKLPIKEIIERADFQLYRAKLNGKNQISF